MTETKRCGKCGRDMGVRAFNQHKRDGLQAWCKDCMRDYSREYNQRPKRREYNQMHQEKLTAEGYWAQYANRPGVKEKRALVARRRSLNPIVRAKNLARWFTRRAIARGEVERLPCAGCGAVEVECHHEDYDQPLLITWLCRECHRKLHKEIKAKGE